MSKSKIFQRIQKKYASSNPEEMSMETYLQKVKADPTMCAGPAERLLQAIGTPVMVDTDLDNRLRRLHNSKIIKQYPAFCDFYGMEDTIEEIVGFIKHAAQGLEESRQVLYLLGPPGSAKSSLSIRLRELMQKEPIYILKGSPVHESPLGLFTVDDAKEIGVAERYCKYPASPWAIKRLEDYAGDISKFTVQKIFPNENKQQAISVAAAGDPNTQDVSTLVGKVDLRKLENFSQNDPDAYNYSGALCKANQGMMEFVEMFKADIKMLNPLLTATQEGNYVGTENIGLLPFEGIILAHSNESEWDKFVNDSTNEAFLDRINLVKVPYVLSVDEEVKIYEKMLRSSELRESPCAPGTLDLLAKFVICTRLVMEDEDSLEPKLLAYNGENVKEKFPNSANYAEYKANANAREGFVGTSTRDAFKILSKVFNFDSQETGANPVQLLEVIRATIYKEIAGKDSADYILFCEAILEYLEVKLYEHVGREFQAAFLGSALKDIGQNKFESYIVKAKYWLEGSDYRNPTTGNILDKDSLNQDLEAIEKPAGIENHKDFRSQVVMFSLQYQARHDGKMPDWTSYRKFKEVLEHSIFNQMEDLLPVLSMSGQGTKEQRAQNQTFITGMEEKGYTSRQVHIIQEWFMQKQSSK
jgi:serine protein kinase